MILKMIERFFIIIGLFVSIAIIVFLIKYDDIVDLGAGYHYHTEQMSILSEHMDIPPYIGYCNYNDRYIIAIQNPCGKNSNVIYTNYTYALGSNIAYYWIIDKHENHYYGPLTDMQYKFLADSLNIDILFKPFN